MMNTEINLNTIQEIAREYTESSPLPGGGT